MKSCKIGRATKDIVKDKQIFWIVLLAVVFWIGFWKHEAVAKTYHKASKSVMEYFQNRH